MPTGYPGTGPTAGRKRDRSEPPRRRGRLSDAERGMIRALALDQPGTPSAQALDRQIDRLARVLRRSPAAVRQALYQECSAYIVRRSQLDGAVALREAGEKFRQVLEQMRGMASVVKRRVRE